MKLHIEAAAAPHRERAQHNKYTHETPLAKLAAPAHTHSHGGEQIPEDAPKLKHTRRELQKIEAVGADANCRHKLIINPACARGLQSSLKVYKSSSVTLSTALCF